MQRIYPMGRWMRMGWAAAMGGRLGRYLAICVMLLSVFMSPLSAQFEECDASGGVDSIYGSLNDRQKKAYDGLDEAVKSGRTLSGLDYLSVKEGEEVRHAFMYDHPEVWYFTSNWELYVLSDSDRCVEFRFDPLFSQQEIWRMDAELASAIPSIDASFVNSDHKMVMRIHDWLCKNVTYVDRVQGDPRDHKGDIYGAFVERQAVCEGYTMAFTYLCHKYGLDCVGVVGSTYKSGGASDHAWNLVKVDGGWYFVDVTWDDSAVSKGGDSVDNREWKVKRDYMLVGSQTMTSHGTFAYGNHKADSLYGIIPSSSAHVLKKASPPAFPGLSFFDGTEKTGVPPTEGYAVVCGTGTERGGYTAMLILQPDYIWSDGTIESKDTRWYILDPLLTISFVALLAAVPVMILLVRIVRRKSGRICPSCGGNLGKDDEFCPSCGQYRERR